MNSYYNRINEIIEENIIFSESDRKYNQNVKSGVYLIFGFSGSGKTTSASQLSKNVIHTDDIYNSQWNKYPNENIAGERCERDTTKILITLISKLNFNSKRTVIEGIHLYSIPLQFVDKYPMTIKGTSGLTSSIRAFKRDRGGILDKIKNSYDLIKWINPLHNRLIQHMESRKISVREN